MKLKLKKKNIKQLNKNKISEEYTKNIVGGIQDSYSGGFMEGHGNNG